MSSDIEKIIRAAKAGGAVLLKYFGQTLETTQKSTAADFKTKADEESEQRILEILNREFPGYNVISEEFGESHKASEYTFIIDPMDGTNNFVLGIPNFTVSIGLMRGEEIVAGVVYAPAVGHAYYAEKGMGAFFADDDKDKRLQVNQETEMTNSTVMVANGYLGDPNFNLMAMTKLYGQHIKRVVFNWSPAYDFCILASGRCEGIIINGSEVYDFAAGKLIAREAGALITDYSGKPEADSNRFFIASNGTALHQQLLEVVKK